jgi:hypothetical protein
MMKGKYENMAEMVVEDIKKFRKKQRKRIEREEKIKKKEGNKITLIEKPIRSQRNK